MNSDRGCKGPLLDLFYSNLNCYYSLLDFSKTCNTIWIEELLLHMLETGIPSTFIHWIWSFFNNRRAHVQLFKVLLKVYLSVPFLPFTLLVLHGFDDDDAAIALFADDVSILTTARKKENAEAAAHSVVNFFVIWSQEWKLNLNTDKSEVCPFSTWSNSNTWNLTIFIGTQKIYVNTTLHLLGVILDSSLMFNAHLKKLCCYYLVFPLSEPQHILLGVGAILL